MMATTTITSTSVKPLVFTRPRDSREGFVGSDGFMWFPDSIWFRLPLPGTITAPSAAATTSAWAAAIGSIGTGP